MSKGRGGFKATKKILSQSVQRIDKVKKSLVRKNENLESERDAARAEAKALTVAMTGQRTRVLDLESELQKKSQEVDRLRTNLENSEGVIRDRSDSLEEARSEIAKANALLSEGAEQLVKQTAASQELRGWLAESKDKATALSRFKTYVHQRFDELGVVADPFPEQTAATGCRIGSRFDWLIKDHTDTMQTANKTLAAANDGLEAAKKWEAAVLGWNDATQQHPFEVTKHIAALIAEETRKLEEQIVAQEKRIDELTAHPGEVVTAA